MYSYYIYIYKEERKKKKKKKSKVPFSGYSIFKDNFIKNLYWKGIKQCFSCFLNDFQCNGMIYMFLPMS